MKYMHVIMKLHLKLPLPVISTHSWFPLTASSPREFFFWAYFRLSLVRGIRLLEFESVGVLLPNELLLRQRIFNPFDENY